MVIQVHQEERKKSSSTRRIRVLEMQQDSQSQSNNNFHWTVQPQRSSEEHHDHDDNQMTQFALSEPQVATPSSPSESRNRWIAGSLLAVSLVGIAIDYCTNRRIEHACWAFIAWVGEHPVWGILAVIGVYTAATILFIPGSILTIGSGFAFRSAFSSTAKGVGFASFAVFLGASLGSIASFLLGRYLFRNWVIRLASNYPILRAIDRALESNGFKIMLLLRLSPLIPFNALDYISGTTSISLKDYSLALCGLLPGTIMFCLVGATASNLADADSSSENGMMRIVSLTGGLIFAIAGVSVASYYSKIELNKILRGSEQGSSIAGQYLEVGPVDDTDDTTAPQGTFV